MIDLKGFRKVNGLTQDELGEFLGIKKSFISKVEHGKERLPKLKFQKLIDNQLGWDVSMLLSSMMSNEGNSGIAIQQNGEQNQIGNVSSSDNSEAETLRTENKMLREQVEELKRQNEKYWNMIEKLTGK